MKKHIRKVEKMRLKLEERFKDGYCLLGKLGIARIRDDFEADMGAIIHNHEIKVKLELDDLHSELMNEQINEKQYKTQKREIQRLRDKELNRLLNQNEGIHLQKLSQAIKNAKKELGEDNH